MRGVLRRIRHRAEAVDFYAVDIARIHEDERQQMNYRLALRAAADASETGTRAAVPSAERVGDGEGGRGVPRETRDSGQGFGLG
jgi:dTDP-4-dehydrorhamnose reductase